MKKRVDAVVELHDTVLSSRYTAVNTVGCMSLDSEPSHETYFHTLQLANSTYLELDRLMAASLSGVHTCSRVQRRWNSVLRELSVILDSRVQASILSERPVPFQW